VPYYDKLVNAPDRVLRELADRRNLSQEELQARINSIGAEAASGEHLTLGQVSEFFEGRGHSDGVSKHLEGCAYCRAMLDGLNPNRLSANLERLHANLAFTGMESSSAGLARAWARLLWPVGSAVAASMLALAVGWNTVAPWRSEETHTAESLSTSIEQIALQLDATSNLIKSTSTRLDPTHRETTAPLVLHIEAASREAEWAKEALASVDPSAVKTTSESLNRNVGQLASELEETWQRIERASRKLDLQSSASTESYLASIEAASRTARSAQVLLSAVNYVAVEQDVLVHPEAIASLSESSGGILAFRAKLASATDDQVVGHLDTRARIDNSDYVERSLLTTNAPGSSGGVNLASIRRGVAVTRASGAIATVGTPGGDRSVAGGVGVPGRSDEEIQIVFDRYKAALYRLYNKELRRDPTLRGQVILKLTIEPDGTVSLCELKSSDMNAPDLTAEVVERVKGFDFGAKAVPAITILYPIEFLPG
jgi:hypothetical protein